jgi:hypothetical protein
MHNQDAVHHNKRLRNTSALYNATQNMYTSTYTLALSGKQYLPDNHEVV